MKRNNIIITEGIIILVLLLIVFLLPSGRKLKKLSDKSLGYEILAEQEIAVMVPEVNTEVIDINDLNPAGGYTAYETGADTSAANTPEPEPEPEPAGKDDDDKDDDDDKEDDDKDDDDKDDDDDKEEEDLSGKPIGVLTQDLIFRSSPHSDEDNFLNCLGEGQEVTIITANVESDDPDIPLWHEVDFYGIRGYISAKYVEIK